MASKEHQRGAAGPKAALLLLLAAGAGAAGWTYLRQPSAGFAAADTLELLTGQGSRTLQIEVADTPEKQAMGLMYRTSLADDRGMLFPHPEPGELRMWMKNTYIPLDMVFIKADGTVHRIEVRTEPLSERVIASNGEVSAVLELAGGAAERLGLKPGDRIRHPLFKDRTDK